MLAQYGILATDSYQPDTALREFILTRDVTCRFPTCRQPARRCQIDHIVPFDPTRAAWTQTHQGNLHLLCARHHQLKTDRTWKVRRDQHTGHTHWTSPLGYQHLRPAEIIDPTHHLPALHQALAVVRTENAHQPAALSPTPTLSPGIISDEELTKYLCPADNHYQPGIDDPSSFHPGAQPPTRRKHRCICADHATDLPAILNRLRPTPKEPPPSTEVWTDSDPPPF